MADEAPTEYFVERVSNMSHANGVFRITFSQQSEGDTLRPQVRLMIPANQLSSILQGLSNAAKDIGEQVQARIEENQTAPANKQAAPKKSKAPAS